MAPDTFDEPMWLTGIIELTLRARFGPVEVQAPLFHVGHAYDPTQHYVETAPEPRPHTPAPRRRIKD